MDQYNAELGVAPNSPIADFMHSGNYQVAYGQNYNDNPLARFQNDPGIQMALQEGTRQLANNYSAKGLGASGAAASGLSQFLYNNYSNFTNNQSNLFNNYQNQLSGLANMGMGYANQIGQAYQQTGANLGNFLGQGYLGIGQNLANAGLGIGSDIGGMQANLGMNLGSGYMNLGPLFSNNIWNGVLLGAQLGNAQNQTNAQNRMSAGLGGFFGGGR